MGRDHYLAAMEADAASAVDPRWSSVAARLRLALRVFRRGGAARMPLAAWAKWVLSG